MGPFLNTSSNRDSRNLSAVKEEGGLRRMKTMQDKEYTEKSNKGMNYFANVQFFDFPV